MLVTTRWAEALSDKEYNVQERHAHELKESYWVDALKHGAYIQQYSGTKDSADLFLKMLDSHRRRFDPLNMDLTRDYENREGSKAQDLTNAICPTIDAVSVLSIWELRSATAICSAPWWTILTLVFKSTLACALQVFATASASNIYDFLFQQGEFSTAGVIRTTAIASAWLLCIRSVAHSQSLTDAGCAACTLTSMSFHRLPKTLFRVSPMLLLCFLAYDKYCWQEVKGTTPLVVQPVLILLQWFFEYMYM